MKKIKKIWHDNKIFIVLGIILIICFLAICTVVVTYFFGGSETVYGDRLDDLDKHPISETYKSTYSSKLKENEKVSKVDFKSKGKIIYIIISYVGDTTLAEAESIAAESITTFDEKLLEYYDINITLEAPKTDNSDGFTIMGAKNKSGTSVVWNNNTPLESDE